MRATIAMLVCLSLTAAPAGAQEFDGRSPFADNERGAFAGLRLRTDLGGRAPKFRASLTVAPTAHSRRGADSRTAMGDGLELSFDPVGSRAEFLLAGRRLDQMNMLGRPAENKKDLSTLATVAIVAGTVLIVGSIAFVHMVNEASCFNTTTGFHGGGDPGDC